MGALTILLDTHAFLWAIAQPDHLSPAARRLVADSTVDILVSSASAWEIATKVRLGRLPDAQALVAAFSDHVQRLGAQELAISIRHALTAGSFAVAHRDPFDRVLAAQALLEGVPLVTRDPAFAAFPIHTIW